MPEFLILFALAVLITWLSVLNGKLNRILCELRNPPDAGEGLNEAEEGQLADDLREAKNKLKDSLEKNQP